MLARSRSSSIERRSAAPLVRLGILRSGALVRADLGAMLFVGSFVGFQFIAVLYLQELRGWSALQTGLALIVAGIDAVIAPTITPTLVRRFGNQRVLLAGTLLAVAAYTAFLPLDVDWSYAMMLPTLILIGLGFAFAFGPLTIAATDGVDESEQGLASALFNASVQFGAALVLAVVTAVNVVATGDDAIAGSAARRLPHRAHRPARWRRARRADHRIRSAPPLTNRSPAPHPSVCGYRSASGRHVRPQTLGWPETLGWGQLEWRLRRVVGATIASEPG